MQRVLETINPNVLINLSKQWATMLEEAQLNEGNFSTFYKRLIAIDGKTIRGNVIAKQNPLHVMSAYAIDLGVCFG